MFYIQESFCISSQQTYKHVDLTSFRAQSGNRFAVIEPAYEEIPEKLLRRMGKAVRLGLGAALPLIKGGGKPQGIIIGTANGGMEDCIKFLNQIIEYDEGMLTPTNFVQSTANAVAGQIGMLLHNNDYNITHVHRGHSFENAIIDAAMHLAERKNDQLLLGAVDEISAYNYNIDQLAGWFKPANVRGKDIYTINTAGSFAGEGAAMFYVSNENRKDSVKLEALTTVTTTDLGKVKDSFKEFLDTNKLNSHPPDIFFSGENGDSRFLPFYNSCEEILPRHTPVARFKHISGEFATASAIALWLACYVLRNQDIPDHMWKANRVTRFKNVLIYNNHKGLQHSFILCKVAQ